MPKRPLTWFLLIWSGLFAIWLISAVSVTGSALEDCAPGDSLCEAGNAGSAVGGTIGVGLILFLWFLVFVPMLIVWFVRRPQTRLCPVCGAEAKRGVTRCTSCGHDFAAAAATAAAPGGPGVPPPPAS
jgi:rubredoxin